MSSSNITASTTSAPTFFQKKANDDLNRSLTGITAALSILGTLAIITTYVLWKEVRTPSRKILVYISIADLVIALGYLWSLFNEPDPSKDVTTFSGRSCEIQSFVTTCANLCSFFWTTFLAVYLYVSVARRRIDLADRMFPCFHLFGWLVPLVITSVALGEGALGNDYDDISAGWCWIRKDASHRLLWMLVTGKAWEITAYILITLLYGLLKWHLHQEVKNRRSDFSASCSLEVAKKAERKMTAIPLVFILLRIWGTVRFFIQTPHPEHEVAVWLVYLQGIGDSAQGFANFMLFCFFTEKFQSRVKALAQKCCCCSDQDVPEILRNPQPEGFSSTVKSRNDPEELINESTHLIRGSSIRSI